ncbi:MAG: Lysyl-tRNA synthetase [Candidatus Nomurabacteria bacterium GW2011_GWF2_35_66]|uniref:ATP-dependent zinc metalloprotease FtsH n=1 Tax=Candidatus Nomurabacteria bacterium GW2011_GWE1_35_16 TaxID=1618761 RepID=A0A0G0BSV7_9BACT|nr:MAG: Lysyl-tRNA synthetase [Candidatus Nomurabacteria bacterium GW2011_GWF1_34_20]KKP63589.1 MAG: Lysyl-tRNA synthetase [Candidatus Nomurabacteria bacterium GW2011_GWE2_34_25]KKP66791.1 MAG: Lysyl-tRNA synthetase [Candidatus Nomurabacteria bacterium GW2011_GWE1_35_16]KKP83417.1 MAG: Lysyl-tRNA synthetase [Candidatus Nomurabacteria bacterium GW2011_GWF2_35_66]
MQYIMDKNTNKKPNQPKIPNMMNQIVIAIFIFMAITVAYTFFTKKGDDIKQMTISDVAKSVVEGTVEKIVVSGGDVNIDFKDKTKGTAKKELESSLSETLYNYGVTPAQLSTTPIEIKTESGFMYWILNLLPFLLPVFLIIFLFWMLTRSAKGQGMQAFTFGQSKARITDPDDKNNKVTFKDVAGAKEAKEELKEIVDFLKNPKKFLDIGARIPKGVLLTGAPGTGKTLLARAVAGEAEVPFFHLSGSEFVEMFVGVGASRVRDLFKMAKKAAPSIVFIDEIDAVGRVRGTGVGGGNDEREQTLNQILVEMDGFEPNEKVIVMAATNRGDVLDPALLRPGRFDRRVLLDLPDRKDREEILAIHSRKKPFAEDVNLKVIAERTPGFSGADLFSIMNEGAILAAREDRKKIAQFDLVRSIEKVMMGPERKSHLLSKQEKEITAYHEAGHALVASVLPHADPVHKVSIVSRGSAGGYTLKLPLEERRLQSKKEFLDDIAMSLGGYVAEEMVFGDITTGPSNDLQVATSLARAMVTRWGMSEEIGPIALESDGGRTMFGQGVNDKEYSERVSALIDGEVSKIMNNAFAVAKQVLTEKRKVLDAIASKLIEVETLEQAEYNEIIVANGIVPKTKDK